MIDLTQIGRVTSPFGKRTSPTAGASTDHKGTDIVLKNYSIPSISSGVVEWSGHTSSGGYTIKIRHDDGSIVSYMHMAAKSSHAVGSRVSEGEIIGTMGSTGISTGDHLHIAVQDSSGNYTNPETYMRGGGSWNPSWETGETYQNPVEKAVSSVKDSALGIVGNVVYFLTLLLIAIFAVYLFCKAFDINIL